MYARGKCAAFYKLTSNPVKCNNHINTSKATITNVSFAMPYLLLAAQPRNYGLPLSYFNWVHFWLKLAQPSLEDKMLLLYKTCHTMFSLHVYYMTHVVEGYCGDKAAKPVTAVQVSVSNSVIIVMPPDILNRNNFLLCLRWPDRHFKPKHDVVLTLIKLFSCLNLTNWKLNTH